MGIIDLLSIIPTYLIIFYAPIVALIDIRVLRLIRIFRIFKLSPYLRSGHTMQIALNNYNLNNLVINKQWNYTIGATWRHFFDNSNLFFVMSRNHLNNTALKYLDYADESSEKILDYKSEEIENKTRLEYV